MLQKLLLTLFLGSGLLVHASGCGSDADRSKMRGGEGSRQLVKVAVAEAAHEDVTTTIELTGNLLPRRRSLIVAEIDGVITHIPRSDQKIEVEVEGRRYCEQLGLDLGVEVSQGDVLVQFDKRDQELAAAAAEARLHTTRKELEKLLAWRRPEEIRRSEAQVESAEAQLETARAEFDRARQLLPTKVVTQSEYDRQRAALGSAKAALKIAQTESAIAKAGPTAEEIAVAKARIAQTQVDVAIQQQKLGKTTIRAPYDAVITDRYVDEGERVTATPRVELMEIMDLSLVIAQVGVPERYLHAIEVGNRVKVRAKGTSEPLPGLVVLINDKVDPHTRTFRTRVALENFHGRLKPGQFVQVEFPIASVGSKLSVPSAAVTFTGGQPQVFVYHDGRVDARQVRIGLQGKQRIEILEGLKAGQRVVVDDPSMLVDDMPVQLNNVPKVAKAPGL